MMGKNTINWIINYIISIHLFDLSIIFNCVYIFIVIFV